MAWAQRWDTAQAGLGEKDLGGEDGKGEPTAPSFTLNTNANLITNVANGGQNFAPRFS